MKCTWLSYTVYPQFFPYKNILAPLSSFNDCMLDPFVDLQTYTKRTIEVHLLCPEAARGIILMQ